MSLKSYSSLPELSRAIAYFVFRKRETNYENIRERFGRFDEKLVRGALEEATSKDPPFIVFDSKNHNYQPSIHLKRLLSLL